MKYRIPVAEYVIKRFEDIYRHRIDEINSVRIDLPTYIYPAGQLGQILYNHLDNKKIHIVGFLDGDNSKHYTRLYGTPLQTYPPNKLLDHSNEPVNIILCKSPYEKEILHTLSYYSHCIRDIIKM